MNVRLAVAMLALVVLLAGCARPVVDVSERPSVPPRVRALNLSVDEQATVLAAAVAEGWFRRALSSLSTPGDRFYVVEPRVGEPVLEALRRSQVLPPHQIVWVEDLDAVPHAASDGAFTDGFAVSVGEVVRASSDSVEVEVAYHDGTASSASSTVRLDLIGSEWKVRPASATDAP